MYNSTDPTQETCIMLCRYSSHPATGMVCVCVLFTWNRPFYPSTSSTISVRTDSSSLERYKFCGHKTRPQRYYSSTFLRTASTVSRADNAMPCHRTGYDGHDMSYSGRSVQIRKCISREISVDHELGSMAYQSEVYNLRTRCSFGATVGLRYLNPYHSVSKYKHLLV